MAQADDLLERPESVPKWSGLRVIVQASVGVAFGMVAGQAAEVLAGGRAHPPGVFAWTGAALGGVVGGLSEYTVARARRPAPGG